MKETNQLEIFFKHKQGLSKKKIKILCFWANQFLNHYSESLDNISELDLKNFCDYIKSTGYADLFYIIIF